MKIPYYKGDGILGFIEVPDDATKEEINEAISKITDMVLDVEDSVVVSE